MTLKYKIKGEWKEYTGSPAFVKLFLEANYGLLFTEFTLKRG